MNQTGLSQSMQPLITSDLLSAPTLQNEWLRLALPFFPSSIKFFSVNEIPYIFSISPVQAHPDNLKVPPKTIIPRCQNCSALPSKFAKSFTKFWKCGVCAHENPVLESQFLPGINEYDIRLGKIQGRKPLFLFIIQNSVFFTNDQVKTALGNALDSWAHSINTHVALISIDEYITVFDLKRPSSRVYIDIGSDFFYIPQCPSNQAQFSKTFSSLKSTHCPKSNFFPFLKTICSYFQRRGICTCILADLIAEPSEFDQEFTQILESRRFSFHLFSEKTADCPKFAKHCDRVRLFEPQCSHLVAPELLKFLNSGFIFNAETNVFAPRCFEIQQVCSRKNVTGSKVTLTVMDGQMCLIPQCKMKYSPEKSIINIQITIDGVFPDGIRVLRVLNFISRSVAKIEQFDGVLFGCYIARKVAVSAYFENIESAYKDYLNMCIDYISAWSSEGNYRRSILSIFRDVPLLLYSIRNCDLFRRGATTTEINSMTINLMSMNIEEIRRMLYPMMILPPLNFPHRLQMSAIGQFKLIIFLRAYDGVAISLDDEDHTDVIESISVEYSLPITLYTNIEVAKPFLMEDGSVTFTQFTEKLEVEVNGRRF